MEIKAVKLKFGLSTSVFLHHWYLIMDQKKEMVVGKPLSAVAVPAVGRTGNKSTFKEIQINGNTKM